MNINEITEPLLQELLDLVPQLLELIIIPFILLLIGKVAAVVIPAIKTRWQEIVMSQPEVIQKFMKDAAEAAYKFVEQKTRDMAIENAEKLKMAIEAWEKNLNTIGYKNVNTDVGEELIEEFIYNLKNSQTKGE